jgi:hypothetical protein
MNGRQTVTSIIKSIGLPTLASFMFEIYLNVYGELREFAYLDRDPKYDEQYDDVNSIIQRKRKGPGSNF